MVAQLKAPRVLEPIIAPTTPGTTGDVGRRAWGFTLNDQGEWVLSERGRHDAAIYQRIVLRYAVLQDTRASLARRYGFGETAIQQAIRGVTGYWLTLPVRQRLLALGVGNQYMNRTEGRPMEIKRALERLAGEAAQMLRDPDRFSPADFERLATDLYLLSGDWAADEG